MEIFHADDIQKLLTSEHPEVWNTIFDHILYAIDEDLDFINVFDLQTPKEIITFTIWKENYQEFLHNLMQYFITQEDYEKCETIKQYLNLFKHLLN